MIVYRVTSGAKIEPVECDSANDRWVFFVTKVSRKRRRKAKRSTWDNYFDTWDEAHAFLIEKAERSLMSLEYAIEREKKTLNELRAMSAAE